MDRVRQPRAARAKAELDNPPSRIRYLRLWIAGIGPWLLLLVALSIPRLGVYGLLKLVPDGFLDVWPILWTLVVVLLWSRRTARTSATNGTRIGLTECLLIWLVGCIFLVNWGPTLIQAVTPYEGDALQQTSLIGSLIENINAARGVQYEDLSTIQIERAPATSSQDAFDIQQQLAALSALLVIWTGVVIVAYIFFGGSEQGNFHANNLEPHRAILTALTIVVMLAFLANVLSFFQVQDRVQSLRAPLDLTRRTAERLIEESGRLSEDVNDLQEAVRYSRDSGVLREPPPAQATGAQVDATLKQQGQYRERQRAVFLDRGDAVLQQIVSTIAVANAATSEINSATMLAHRSVTIAASGLAPVASVLGYNDTIVADLESHRDKLAHALDPLRDDTFDPVELGSISSLAEEIDSSARQLNLHASLATEALVGLEPSGTAMILWLAAFYLSFVLFPWVLLLMFLYRKRRHRAIEIVNDLWRLDPSRTLLYRALGTPRPPKDLGPAAFRRILVERAFSNREYVLSAMLLTALTAAGWYYFLYPRADAGIADWVNMGLGMKEMTIDLAKNASPIPMGFAGAYFYVSQMLLRRYLAGDLYPSAYLQASVRIIWVFTLSVALAVLLPSDEHGWKIGAVIAFVTGIFPQEGFMLISSAATGLATQVLRRLVDKKQFSTAIESAPLTNLDGINIWVESRLLEENIENVQGMATAPMEQLVVGTYYPASRIVDWVDQAILYTHCGDKQELCPPLRRIGVRTASDLLDSATGNGLRASALNRQTFASTAEGLSTLETAVAAVVKPDDACPKVTKDMLREMCNVIWPDPNLTYVLNYRLDLGPRDRPAMDKSTDVVITRPVRGERRRKVREAAAVTSGPAMHDPSNGKAQ